MLDYAFKKSRLYIGQGVPEMHVVDLSLFKLITINKLHVILQKLLAVKKKSEKIMNALSEVRTLV